MTLRNSSLAAALMAVLCSGAAQAQNNVVKFGITYYDTHSSTSGLSTDAARAGRLRRQDR